jgi:uncharacterized protein YdhG (YjbR/CyaY superfamily)
MPATKTTTEPDGFTAEERAAIKQRAAELRAQGKKGAKAADGLEALLEAIAALPPEDRTLAQEVHRVVTRTAPGLVPRTYYGFPAYANEAGNVVVFFKFSSKFKTRYSTLEFNPDANLDDGDLWPTAYALLRWSPAVEETIARLIRTAVS